MRSNGDADGPGRRRVRPPNNREIQHGFPDLVTLDDTALVNEYLSGRYDALAELFERHKSNVFRTARRILGNHSEAEETVQRVFLELHQTITQFDANKGPFKTWLLRKATFRALNQKGHLKSRRFYLSEQADDLPSEPDDTFLGLGDQEVYCLVNEMLKALPAEELEIVRLVYFEGLTLEEAARKTGKNLRAVRYRLDKGLDVLRAAFQDREHVCFRELAPKPKDSP